MTETKGQCPAHNNTETQGSDSYVWSDTKEQGICNSCGLVTWLHRENGELWGRHPGGKNFKVSTGEFAESSAEGELVEEPKGQYNPWRGITRDTMEHFGVTSDEQKVYFKYPSGGYKVRKKEEKEFYAKNLKGDELFGMQLFPAGCSKMVTITEGECFTPDAEVYTGSGWVALGDYKCGPVLCVSQDGTASFDNPIAVVNKQFEGNLVEYKSGSYYSLTTPDHNLIRTHPKEGYKKFKAGVNSFFNIPRVFDWAPTRCHLSKLEAQVWIMLSADFTFRGSGDIYGSLKKERKAKRVKELLDAIGVRYVVNIDSRDYYSFYIHRGHNLPAQKELPKEIIWHEDKHELLEEIIFWDGNYVKTRNQAEFSTNREVNADVVQMLAHSCGYVSTIIPRENEFGKWMKVSILFGKTHSSTQGGFTEVPYQGRVMCLTVPSGMLVVRQQGSISISGNCDAMSAWQMLQNGRFTNPVVSLPGATPSGKLWEKCKGWLDSFDKIILSVDNDEPGRKVAEVISEIFPGKVFIMDHSQHKDANDFLMNGDGRAYVNAWWKAKRHKPESILSDVEDYLSLYDDSPDFEYFQTGIQELDDKMLGICKGHVTLIQAESGLGKTEFCRYLETKALETGKYRVAAMHLEESKVRSLLGLVSYKLNTNVTIKKFIDEKQLDSEVRQSIKEITESENFVTFDFDMQEGHEGLIKQVRYLVAALSVDYIFVEPIQDCVTGNSSEKEGKLADLITQLSTLASKLNVGIVVVAHQNSEGGAMYSSMITKRAAFELLLKRDRDSDDPEERNRTHVVIGRKNRTGLGNGPAGAVDFDLESYTLTPVTPPQEPPTPNHKEDF